MTAELPTGHLLPFLPGLYQSTIRLPDPTILIIPL
jgi:hypothetical protein